MKNIGNRIFFLLFFCMLTSSGVLFAHEHRKIGDYEVVVGFLNEPAFSGQMNGLDLRVSSGDQPVEGLEKSLNAKVLSSNGKFLDLKMRTRYKQPGNYAGYFLPTKPGQYIFQVQGQINGVEVNETFKSGEGSFHDVEDGSSLQFPNANDSK